MPSALIIRPSSLGDIVHALPLVHDLKQHQPSIAVDWVAEEPFAALVALNHGVRHVIQVALRRWRYRLLQPSTWREMAAFRRELARESYDAVIDLQEQVKGALVAALARGPVHGPDRTSIREPLATLAYRHTHRIDPNQHLIDRCRALAGAAFGYQPAGPAQFDLSPQQPDDAPGGPYAIFFHSTSRNDKLWSEAYWRSLISHFTRAGLTVLLPWGDALERSRSERLAAGIPSALVPDRRSLPELASLFAGAELVCGVDTGLVHLAAAVGAPTVSLFVATDPRLAGVERASVRARDLGGVGVVPTPAEVIAAATDIARGRELANQSAS